MKKLNFIKSVIFAGILGVSSPLLAEESGWFAGVQFGGGGVELGYEYCETGHSGTREKYCPWKLQEVFEGGQWGLLGGYKQFFTPKFGLRYYGAFNMGKYSYDGDDIAYKSVYRTDTTAFTNKLNEYTFHIHTDILYNFITSETFDFGVFAGVGLGYVLYKYTIQDGPFLNAVYSEIDTARDFDIRFAAGLRVNLAKRHDIEAFIQLPMLKQRENFVVAGWDGTLTQVYGITLTNTPSSSLGIRYIFSF